ncbi:hypothetical protein [Methanocella sp. MCL-LM]|uniref:hypothetical protein n=1 Tax=Methanocella sp. MCL-LM TaxID=3412035 RepID=UPI003C77E2EF
MTVDKKGSRTIFIEDEKDIQKMEGIPLRDIKIQDKIAVLKVPLILDVQYEDDEYIISNEELCIHSVSDSLKDAIEDIKKSIETLWIEYVDADSDTLTDDAIAFRNKLKDMFRE